MNVLLRQRDSQILQVWCLEIPGGSLYIEILPLRQSILMQLQESTQTVVS